MKTNRGNNKKSGAWKFFNLEKVWSATNIHIYDANLKQIRIKHLPFYAMATLQHKSILIFIASNCTSM